MNIRWSFPVAALGLGLVLTACGGGSEPDGSTEPLAVGIYEGTLASAINQLTVKKGFLEDEGLEGELVGFTDGGQMMAAFIGGETQISTVSPGFWPSIAQGECFKTFGNEAQQYYTILSTDEAHVPEMDEGFPASVRAVKGMRIGVVARGTATERLASLVLEDAGLDPSKDVTFVATGGAQTAVTAFENNQIDVLFSYPPVDEILKKNGTPYHELVNLFDGSVDVLEDAMVTMVGASCDFAEEQPEVVASFCRAYSKAYEFATDPANREEMQEFTAEIMNVDEETGASIWDTYGEAVFSAGAAPVESVWDAQPSFYPGIETAPAFSEYAMTSCG